MEIISAEEKRKLVRELARVVKSAGETILNSRIEIKDTRQHKGHEESTVDLVARRAIIEALEEYVPELQGKLRFELLPYDKKLIEVRSEDSMKDLTLIMDEIDGTTNVKRAMASRFRYPPQAGVCIALCTGDTLSDLQIGVIFTLDTKETFAGIRIEEDIFYTFKDKELLYPEEVTTMCGDSKYRLLVIKYSNSKRVEIAEVEEALWSNDFRIYEGCRSSSMDVLGILRNKNDAYIDIRALFPEKCGAQLQVYDVAAAIAIALGVGLEVYDVFGGSWMKYQENEPIPLIISRPGIKNKILESIGPVVEKISQKYNYKRKQ